MKAVNAGKFRICVTMMHDVSNGYHGLEFCLIPLPDDSVTKEIDWL